MRKRIAVALFMLACLLISGCGSGSDPNSMANESYDETKNSEEESQFNTENVEPEDGMEEPDEIEDDSDTPAEAKGIIVMVRQQNGWELETQLITINPSTGEQRIIVNFSQQILANTEILDSSSLEDSDVRYLHPSALTAFAYGNLTNWFSDDYTKMIAVRVFWNRSQEQHAGWIDANGEFFDVSEAVGLAHETDFSNPDPIKHDVIGFENNMFIFCEGEKYFQIPLSDTTKDQILEVNGDNCSLISRSQKLPSMVNDEIYPTDWIDENNCIADFLSLINYRTHIEYVLKSVFLNAETGEITEYIPESDRCNWSGVLSPDGATIAFLSTPTRDDGLVELYTIPTNGGEPTRIPLVSNSDVLVNIEEITQGQLDMQHEYYRPGYRASTECFLLDWR
ncbi:TolB family protein [Mediterraneibacter agrestimuris]|uniref:TolB family protein n=1 Tax=Mediterraneibacter agrestimuris TaxID=2941333 RepID=UPI00203EA8BB|nr:hypothetical protein [Mediterraneibacter agrestimuris]